MAGGTFPTSVPTYTVTAGAETANGAAGGTGLSGLLNQFEVDVTALAAKMGSGAATPTLNKVLVGSGTGTSTWSSTLAGLTLTSPVLNTPTINNPVFPSPPTSISRLPGEIVQYGGFTAPTDWLLCNGAAVSRSTYATLFAAIAPVVGTCTITNATPAVVTLTAHGLQTGDAIYLTTTGGLPTGLSANTLYYAVRIDANTFNLSTTRANAYAATKIATSSAGSGVHTLNWCAFGLGDGSTTFNLPDLRGRVGVGNDSMGGTAANLMSLAQTQGAYGNAGASGGEQGHQLITAELAAHKHGVIWKNDGSLMSNSLASYVSGNTWSIDSVSGSFGQGFGSGDGNVKSAGSDTPHNNVQPTLLVNYIIKT